MEPDPDLESLLSRIAGRETAALSELHQTISPLLLATTIKILKNRPESEDVLQEIFLKIWKSATRYQDTSGSPLSWIITIARNTAYDRYRQKTRQTAQYETSREDLTEIAYSKQPSQADDALLSVERREDIRRALRQLAPDQRQAIELAFFSGHTQQEISDQLGIPLGTIKARIRRGMQTLKPQLTPIA